MPWSRAVLCRYANRLLGQRAEGSSLFCGWTENHCGLGRRFISKPLPRQQASSRDWMLKNTCILCFFCMRVFVIICLCAFGCFFWLYGVPQSVLKCLHTSWCWSGRIRQEVTTISHHETPVSASHLEMESSWNCGMCRKSVWKCNIVVFFFLLVLSCAY